MIGTRKRILVDISSQSLQLVSGDELLQNFQVSTGRNGPGERQDSGCTPRGLHRVRIRIGDGCPEGAVFVGRRPTGEIYGRGLAKRSDGRASDG